MDSKTPEWSLRPGQSITRTQLHNRYGGTRQGGISPSRTTPNVLIFSDPSIGREHGCFDHWEGEVFHYYGQGRTGNQQMIGNNAAVLNHVDHGRALRVFEGAKGTASYVGEFELDSRQPWYPARAPETGGGPLRDVIVFRLVPVGQTSVWGEPVTVGEVAPSLNTPYRRSLEQGTLGERAAAVTDPDVIDRGTKAHQRLQNLVADFAASRGFEPLSPGLGDPEFDVGWWEDDLLVVVEVKSITAANEVGQLRLGLGQVLDYEDRVRRAGKNVQPVLAVERAPTDQRWLGICERHGVVLIWPEDLEPVPTDRLEAVLRLRDLVALRGLGLALDGHYFVPTSRHRIDDGAYEPDYTVDRRQATP